MEDDGVSASSSKHTGEDGEISSSPVSIAKILVDAFPLYLNMGMTFQQYWYEDPCLVIAYRKAYNMKCEYDNSMLWLQGKYIYDALLAVAPRFNDFKPKKAAKYNEQPYPISEDMRNRQEIEKTRKAAMNMLEKAKRHNAELAKNGGDINGGSRQD